MIHKCKVQCHAIDPNELESMGIKKDVGKWLPFAIDLGIVIAVKMSTDEVGEPTYNCSSIFCRDGNTFILDTPFDEFFTKWNNYINTLWDSEEDLLDNNDHPDF